MLTPLAKALEQKQMLSEMEILLYKLLVRPHLFSMYEEDAHAQMVSIAQVVENSPLLKFAMQKFLCYESAGLENNIAGMHVRNPVGVAGGFDKEGTLANAISYSGAGFTEIGTVTQKRWPGRDKPRIKKFPQYESAANWMGFPSEGVDSVIQKAKDYTGAIPVMANVGITQDVVANVDLALDALVEAFGKLIPYFSNFVLNKSSPNTSGLRQLSLYLMLERLDAEFPDLLPNLWVKIAPDSSSPDKTIYQEIDELLEMRQKFPYAGIIAANTTIDTNIRDFLGLEIGGVSGDLVIAKTMPLIRFSYRQAPDVPLIAVGGIKNPGIALDYIKSGAVALEVMTPLFYNGPAIFRSLNEGIANYMKKEGINHYSELVGVSVSPNRTQI